MQSMNGKSGLSACLPHIAPGDKHKEKSEKDTRVKCSLGTHHCPYTCTLLPKPAVDGPAIKIFLFVGPPKPSSTLHVDSHGTGVFRNLFPSLRGKLSKG